MQSHRVTSRATAVLAALAAWATGACDSDPGAESRAADPAETTGAEPAEPEPPPEAPPLADLSEPAERTAEMADPEWDGSNLRYGWEVESVPATFGTGERVTQLLFGEEPAEGTMLTFYGGELEPGEYEVLPATDEVRAEHAGGDSDVFVVAVGKPGEEDLRSESGTVTIETADDDAIIGTFDVVAKSRIHRTSAAVRGRFHALHDDYMDALLSHEAAIREQLKRR